jgi:hypothetical protein
MEAALAGAGALTGDMPQLSGDHMQQMLMQAATTQQSKSASKV